MRRFDLTVLVLVEFADVDAPETGSDGNVPATTDVFEVFNVFFCTQFFHRLFDVSEHQNERCPAFCWKADAAGDPRLL